MSKISCQTPFKYKREVAITIVMVKGGRPNANDGKMSNILYYLAWGISSKVKDIQSTVSCITVPVL